MKAAIRKLTTSKPTLEHLGWYSMVVILVAYLLVSAELVQSSSLPYQLLNLSGALGYLYYSQRRKVYPSVIANGIWAVIGVVSIIGIVL